MRQESPEALARRTREVEADGLIGQPRGAIALGDLATEHRAYRAVNIADRQLEVDRNLVLDGVLGVIDQLVIERLLQTVILTDRAEASDTFRNIGREEHLLHIEPLGLPMIDGIAHLEAIRTADHLVHRAEPKLRHDLPEMLGDEEEVVDRMLGADP